MRLDNATLRLYEACGNRLLVIHLSEGFSPSDNELRRELQQAGLSSKADSVLVITGDPASAERQGYHVTMDVFEPRGRDPFRPELHGGWSTMCGNGIRAISCYLRDTLGSVEERFIIQTRSGLREVLVLPDNNFRVCMGSFSTRQSDLARYAHDSDIARIKTAIRNIGISIQEVMMGLNGNSDAQGRIDGEPHLVIFVKNGVAVDQLREQAPDIAAPLIKDQERFPEGINVSLVSIGEQTGNRLGVNACTFERGVEYVTASCGTAATVIGSHLLEKGTDLRVIDVHMPGGVLHIERDNAQQYYLTGAVFQMVMNEAEVR